mgnify:CR=1 FL=1
MENAQNLKPALTNAVRNQIGAIRERPFSGSGQTSLASGGGKASKLIDGVENGLNKLRGRLRIFNRDVGGFVIEIP